MDALNGTSRLAGGKEAVLRVDPVSTSGTVPLPTSGKISVFNPTTSTCVEIALSKTTDSRGVYPASMDPRTLRSSLYARIPGSLVKPGMSFVAVLDTQTALSESDANNTTIAGNVLINSALSDNIHFYTMNVDGTTGSYPASSLASFLKRFLPFSSVTIDAGNTFIPSSFNYNTLPRDSNGNYMGTANDANELLSDFSQFCMTQHGRPLDSMGNASQDKCVLVHPSNLHFPLGGLGEVTGRAVIMRPFGQTEAFDGDPADIYTTSGWINYDAQILLHELGHVYSLGHGNCGNPGYVDDRLYSDGALGNAGFFDHERNFFVSNRGHTSGTKFFDMTSYCLPGLISDRAYRLVMNYSLTGQYGGSTEAAARTDSNSKRYLMITVQGNKLALLPVSRMPLVTAPADASILSKLGDLAKGTDVRVMTTHDGANPYGPYFIKMPEGGLDELKSKLGNRLKTLTYRRQP